MFSPFGAEPLQDHGIVEDDDESELVFARCVAIYLLNRSLGNTRFHWQFFLILCRRIRAI